jgi:hypothetical protein
LTIVYSSPRIDGTLVDAPATIGAASAATVLPGSASRTTPFSTRPALANAYIPVCTFAQATLLNVYRENFNRESQSNFERH